MTPTTDQRAVPGSSAGDDPGKTGMDPTMCYVASHPGVDGYFFASVIDSGHNKETAKTIAKLIREGAVIERVTLTQAKAGLDAYLRPKQGTLIPSRSSTAHRSDGAGDEPQGAQAE